jgi:hypothetical protein
MSIPLNADHGENGLALSSIMWDTTQTRADFNFYTNRAIGATRAAGKDGAFRFFSVEEFPLPAPGWLSNPPWDGDPSQPRDLSMCRGDILSLDDIPARSMDANLRTIQDVAWTWALPDHTIRLTLDGYWSTELIVHFPYAVSPINMSGTWTLIQDFR